MGSWVNKQPKENKRTRAAEKTTAQRERKNSRLEKLISMLYNKDELPADKAHVIQRHRPCAELLIGPRAFRQHLAHLDSRILLLRREGHRCAVGRRRRLRRVGAPGRQADVRECAAPVLGHCDF